MKIITDLPPSAHCMRTLSELISKRNSTNLLKPTIKSEPLDQTRRIDDFLAKYDGK